MDYERGREREEKGRREEGKEEEGERKDTLAATKLVCRDNRTKYNNHYAIIVLISASNDARKAIRARGIRM